METKKILIVRKMSSNEYYYQGKHKSQSLKESHENHTREFDKILRILKKAKRPFDVATRDELSERLVSGYGAVISAGGDGTVIAAAAYNRDIPQLNLKTDPKSDGALCYENIAEVMAAFLNGEYGIEEWSRQDVSLDGKFVSRALNETYIGQQMRVDKMARYNLFFADAETGLTVKEFQRNSGLLIVTGTGSTAWGDFKPYPRNSPDFEFDVTRVKEGIIRHGRATYIRVIYKGHEGKFSIDTKDYSFPLDSELEIELSKHPLRVIIPHTK